MTVDTVVLDHVIGDALWTIDGIELYETVSQRTGTRALLEVHPTRDPEQAARARQSARLSSRFPPELILEPLDLGYLSDDRLFVLREGPPGRVLASLDIAGTPRAIAIARSLVLAVAEVHRAGFALRRLIPESVYVEDGSDRVRLYDLRHVMQLERAPEAAAGDVLACAQVIYALVTGAAWTGAVAGAPAPLAAILQRVLDRELVTAAALAAALS